MKEWMAQADPPKKSVFERMDDSKGCFEEKQHCFTKI